MSKGIAVISGLGNGVGTGAATARLFSHLGYSIALISRPRREVNELREEIRSWGGVAEIFSLETYDYPSIDACFLKIDQTWPADRLKFANYNTGAWSRIAFLEIKPTVSEIVEIAIQIG